MKKLPAILSVPAVMVVMAAVVGCMPSAAGTISACRNGDGAVRLIDAEGGASCASGETLVEWNQQGPAGPAGPQGPAGPAGPGQVLDTVTVSGLGSNPMQGGITALGMHATVDVPASAGVHVVATKTVGTNGSDPYAILDAWICHRPAGTTGDYTTVGEPSTMVLTGSGRVPLTLSTVLEGLPVGPHEVGLCSQTAHALRWNSNSTSHVTAMVIAGG